MAKILAGFRFDAESDREYLIVVLAVAQCALRNAKGAQQILYHTFQVVDCGLCPLAVPSRKTEITGEPKREVHRLTVGCEGTVRSGFGSGGVIAIDVAEFVEAEVRSLAVDIMTYRFQSAIKQCLAHQAEVLTEWIHHHHCAATRIHFILLVI